MSSISQSYGSLLDAVKRTAGDWALTPMQVRTAVAVFQHGPLVSDELEQILGDRLGGSTTRRTLCTLYARGVCEGHDSNGQARGPGKRSTVSLTPRGELIARDALRRWADSENAI